MIVEDCSWRRRSEQSVKDCSSLWEPEGGYLGKRINRAGTTMWILSSDRSKYPISVPWISSRPHGEDNI